MPTQNRKILCRYDWSICGRFDALSIRAGISRRWSAPNSFRFAGSGESWEAVTLGRVEPRSGEIKVAAPVPGQIADVLVKANEDVFAGQLLVRLDDEEALARVAEADAQVALHKRARNDQATPAGSADRRKAEDAVANSGEVLPMPYSRWTRSRLTGGQAPHRRPISIRPAPLWRVCRIVCGTSRRRSLRSGRPRTRRCRTRLEGELNVAQADWTLARATLEKTRIRAPIDGVILQVEVKKGELAVPTLGPALLIMGDLSALRVRAEVDQQNLGKMRVGQRAVVRAAAFRGREFDGKVSSIARIVGQSRINSGDPHKFSDVEVLEIVVDLSDPGPLVVGEQVDVYFKSGQAETE